LETVNSTKLTYLLSRLEETTPTAKCIVFTQFWDNIDIIVNFLKKSSIKFVGYHTRMTPSARSSAITTFNTNDDIRLIVMNTDLAAYGINLTAATYIFILDPVWDVSKERQAIKRAHRIGQTQDVFVEKLIMKHSIEELMRDLNRDRSLEKLSGSTKQDDDAIQQRKIHSLLGSLKLLKEHCYKKTEKGYTFDTYTGSENVTHNGDASSTNKPDGKTHRNNKGKHVHNQRNGNKSNRKKDDHEDSDEEMVDEDSIEDVADEDAETTLVDDMDVDEITGRNKTKSIPIKIKVNNNKHQPDGSSEDDDSNNDSSDEESSAEDSDGESDPGDGDYKYKDDDNDEEVEKDNENDIMDEEDLDLVYNNSKEKERKKNKEKERKASNDKNKKSDHPLKRKNAANKTAANKRVRFIV